MTKIHGVSLERSIRMASMAAQDTTQQAEGSEGQPIYRGVKYMGAMREMSLYWREDMALEENVRNRHMDKRATTFWTTTSFEMKEEFSKEYQLKWGKEVVYSQECCTDMQVCTTSVRTEM